MALKGLKGKVAIVTGAARGIGKGICLRLIEEGVSVVYADVNAKEAEQAAAEARKAGGKAIARKCDGVLMMHREDKQPTRDHKKEPPRTGIVNIYSEKVRGRITIEDMVGDLAGLLDRLGIPNDLMRRWEGLAPRSRAGRLMSPCRWDGC